ncbi:MAG: pentapeptide repeat-containing protein [Synechococcus sp.]
MSRPWRFPWFCRRGGEYLSCIIRQSPQSLAGLDVALDGDTGRALPGTGAFLRDLQLPGSDLSFANLQDANLLQANLQDAYLLQVNLQDANLLQVNLQDADLPQTNLQDADLLEANLQDAYLSFANLQDADLAFANLQDAYLSGANLQDADFSGVSYTTEENSSEEICLEIYKGSNPDFSDREIQTAFDNGWVHPCPTIWERAVYNDYTVDHFPDQDFDFEAAGMIHIDKLSPEELCNYSWYRRENDC